MCVPGLDSRTWELADADSGADLNSGRSQQIRMPIRHSGSMIPLSGAAGILHCQRTRARNRRSERTYEFEGIHNSLAFDSDSAACFAAISAAVHQVRIQQRQAQLLRTLCPGSGPARPSDQRLSLRPREDLGRRPEWLMGRCWLSRLFRHPRWTHLRPSRTTTRQLSSRRMVASCSQ